MPLHGQLATGSITGAAIDPNGANISGAAVTAKNIATNLTRTIQTNASGYYVIPALPPGQYQISASAAGFEVSTANVTLLLEQTLNFDFHLEVGSSTVTVNVDAASSTLELQTESHQVSDLLNFQSIENLPSNGRSVFQTLAAATNVARIGNYYAGDISDFSTTNNSLTIGGTAPGTSSYLEDGVYNVSMFTRTANMQPSAESVQEVSLTANGASARFDQPSVVNVITKSGTNSFHGRVYDYLENNLFNANGYFSSPATPLRYNQFGANLGGPILKNKLQFFFDYSGLRNYSSGITRLLVPTNAEHNGDFSQDSFTIYDPSTYNPSTGSTSPFPGNVIPQGRISAFAQAALQFYPLPTGSSIPTLNFQRTIRNASTYNSYLGRLDYTIGAHDNIYGAYMTTNPLFDNPSFSTSSDLDSLTIQDNTTAYVEEVHTFGSSIVNVGKFAYNGGRYLHTLAGAGKQNWLQLFGVPNLNPAPAQYSVPAVQMTNYPQIGDSFVPQGANQHYYEFADEVDWTIARHHLFFGGDVGLLHYELPTSLWSNGQFSFTGQYSANHVNNSGGSSVADLLLGFPTSVSAGSGVMDGHPTQWTVSPYLQDDWKVSGKLVLNLGLRYDFYQSPSDAKGGSNIYDVYTNTNHPGSFRQTYWNFAPRLGFAYSIDSHTTLHGGYGIYYSPFIYVQLQNMFANPPNFHLQVNTYSLANPTSIANTIAANPTISSGALFTIALKVPTPYVQQWNLAVQRSVGNNWLLTVAYLGEKFVHSNLRTNPNQARELSSPTDTTPLAARRPFPYIGDVLQISNVGEGNYNGLQAELQRRFASGFSLLTSYVYSKALDIGSADNLYPEYGPDPKGDYGLADYNTKHAFKVSGIYALPIGTKGRWLQKSNWLDNQVFGGWQLSMILQRFSGWPFSSSATDLSNTGSNHAMRADRICNPNKNIPGGKTLQNWFDKACLVQPAVGKLGNDRRNGMYGPADTSLDASFFKTFSLMKETGLQFRMDAFGLANHPLASNPSGSVTDPTEGQVTSFSGARVIQLSLKLLF
jgi:outer membrane receptor protein involved in Fe transport